VGWVSVQVTDRLLGGRGNFGRLLERGNGRLAAPQRYHRPFGAGPGVQHAEEVIVARNIGRGNAEGAVFALSRA
jgi:hypothetical protein